MAAMTVDQMLPSFGPLTKIDIEVVGADTFFAGAVVFADDTTGLAQVGSLNVADHIIGFSPYNQQPTVANELITLIRRGIIGIPISGTTVADIGRYCVLDSSAITDNPADLQASGDLTDAADDIALGTIVTVLNGFAYVDLGIFFPRFEATALAAFKNALVA